MVNREIIITPLRYTTFHMGYHLPIPLLPFIGVQLVSTLLMYSPCPFLITLSEWNLRYLTF